MGKKQEQGMDVFSALYAHALKAGFNFNGSSAIVLTIHNYKYKSREFRTLSINSIKNGEMQH